MEHVAHKNVLFEIFRNAPVRLREISEKIIGNKAVSIDDALFLSSDVSISSLGLLANYVRELHNGKNAFFNHNIHLEPTNECVNHCKFCTYRKDEGNGYRLSLDDISEKLSPFSGKKITEVHITGGIQSSANIDFYCDILRTVKNKLPEAHIKAFSAVELDMLFRKEHLSNAAGLKKLKDAGLQSIPGGGAEIFNSTIRKQICPDKTSSKNWLSLHETAHRLNIRSNATMLYGHIETMKHRIEHMELLRNLQERTGGFLCFIPLKYRNRGNAMEQLGESSILDDIKTFAISRIFLHNIPHIKVYWPMLGTEFSQLMLSFGADDMDGTIQDTTTIYKEAVASGKHELTEVEIRNLIHKAGYIAVERDSFYNPIKS